MINTNYGSYTKFAHDIQKDYVTGLIKQKGLKSFTVPMINRKGKTFKMRTAILVKLTEFFVKTYQILYPHPIHYAEQLYMTKLIIPLLSDDKLVSVVDNNKRMCNRYF